MCLKCVKQMLSLSTLSRSVYLEIVNQKSRDYGKKLRHI